MRLRQLMKVNFYPLMKATLIAAPCFWMGQASAQSYLSPGYIMGEITTGLGFVKPEPAPDFVVRGRPDPSTLEYVPLKLPPRNFHSDASKPEARIEAEAGAIAELEAARARTQGRAAGTSQTKSLSKSLTPPPEEDPKPMKWNAWDTE